MTFSNEPGIYILVNSDALRRRHGHSADGPAQLLTPEFPRFVESRWGEAVVSFCF